MAFVRSSGGSCDDDDSGVCQSRNDTETNSDDRYTFRDRIRHSRLEVAKQTATKPRKLSKPARPYVSPYVVTFDESEIVVTFEGSRRESVRWDDITFVTIQIENEGFLDIPYWIIVGKIGAGGKPIGCVYSNDAVGGREILVALQNRLPGFNNIAVVQAMDMMSGGVRVWEREAAAVNRSPAK